MSEIGSTPLTGVIGQNILSPGQPAGVQLQAGSTIDGNSMASNIIFSMLTQRLATTRMVQPYNPQGDQNNKAGKPGAEGIEKESQEIKQEEREAWPG